MNEKILKRLFRDLAKVKRDRDFMRSVALALDSDEKKEKMINFLETHKNLSTSDVYRKEMELTMDTSRN
ncbi:MAG: hypothetical protein Q4B15_08710 [Lachnospiraceae bacterium]|nr:hypothetical protein [Lachnospiraceae bacterium]